MRYELGNDNNMTNYSPHHTIVLADYGFDEDGPYLSLNDLESKTQRRYSVRDKTFSLRRLAQRHCVGRFDLDTGARTVCPLDVVLLPDAKDDMCPACQEATGFNPSFYYADFVSPQQRAYNLTPHFVYLAYFAPHFVKAGITAEVRGMNRLLEQGARSARVVGHFEDAYQARELEAVLCAQSGILETMRASKKADLLASERYDAREAAAVLDNVVARLGGMQAVIEAGFDPSEAEQDLSSFYFGSTSPSFEDMQPADSDPNLCGGHCVGMVGCVLVFKQQGTHFLASLKNWESHEIDLTEDEVLCTYDFAPQQMSLL